ncbi:MAG: P-II family nitrogen regulator [Planctomycetota bacterium]
MKLIQAVVEPDVVHRVQEELNRVEVFRLTVSDVQTLTRIDAATPGMTFESRPAVRLEIAVNESFVKPTLDALYRALREEGEERGTLYVLPLKDAIRIRTGERGPEAI